MMSHYSCKTALRCMAVLTVAFLPALHTGAQADKKASPAKFPSAILGIRPGMDVDEAHEMLQKQGAVAPKADEDAPRQDADKDAASVPDPDKKASLPKQAAGDEDSDSGHQEVWTLRGTPYARLVMASDDKGRLLWVTGFARLGQEIAFSKLGDTKKAAAVSPSFAVWNVLVPNKPYRVTARGRGGKASVVTLLTLAQANPNGMFSPAVMPSAKR